jgi:exodeoxyribonuclease VII small subunit
LQRPLDLTYLQALTETEAILSEIEAQEVDIDTLAEKVRRASELIAFCRARLRQTQDDVDKVFTEQ